jgi:predicted kinase
VAGHELSLRAIASGSGSAFVAIGAARGTEAVSLSQDVVTVL